LSLLLIVLSHTETLRWKLRAVHQINQKYLLWEPKIFLLYVLRKLAVFVFLQVSVWITQNLLIIWSRFPPDTWHRICKTILDILPTHRLFTVFVKIYRYKKRRKRGKQYAQRTVHSTEQCVLKSHWGIKVRWEGFALHTKWRIGITW